METLTPEVMERIIHDVVLNIPPEQSKLAPMTAEQLAWREKVTPEIREAEAKGQKVHLPDL